jgi:hypothetical protein
MIAAPGRWRNAAAGGGVGGLVHVDFSLLARLMNCTITLIVILMQIPRTVSSNVHYIKM